MDRNSLNRPAIVKAVDGLAELATNINAYHAIAEESTRKGLVAYRNAGEALLEAKQKCGHGNWLAWLKKNVKFSNQRASECMRLAAGWDKLPPGGNLSLKEALTIIAAAGGPPPEHEPGDNSDKEPDGDLCTLMDDVKRIHQEILENLRDTIIQRREMGQILRKIKEQCEAEGEWQDNLSRLGIGPDDVPALLRAADDREELSREVLERRLMEPGKKEVPLEKASKPIVPESSWLRVTSAIQDIRFHAEEIAEEQSKGGRFTPSKYYFEVLRLLKELEDHLAIWKKEVQRAKELRADANNFGANVSE
jgi:Protein of unknown function (DUF3102)